MRESEIMRKIRDLSSGPVRLWRNHLGTGLQVHHPHAQTKQAIISECIAHAIKRGGSASRCTFGLPVGSGDLIGFRQVTIGPEHVGLTLAQFVSMEVKTATGSVRPEQVAWRDMVEGKGGMAAIARSVEDATKALDTPLRG